MSGTSRLQEAQKKRLKAHQRRIADALAKRKAEKENVALEQLELGRRLRWDLTRQLTPAVREALQALIDSIRATRATSHLYGLSRGAWTDREVPLGRLAQKLINLSSVDEIHHALVLLSLEASGDRVNLGLEVRND